MSPSFERMMLRLIVASHARTDTETYQRRLVIGWLTELCMEYDRPDDARCLLPAACCLLVYLVTVQRAHPNYRRKADEADPGIRCEQGWHGSVCSIRNYMNAVWPSKSHLSSPATLLARNDGMEGEYPLRGRSLTVGNHRKDFRCLSASPVAPSVR